MWLELTDAVAAFLKAIFVVFIWNFVLFNIGRCALLCATAGRYPRGRFLDVHVGRISATGIAVLAVAWFMIAIYNNLHTGHA